MSSKNVEKLNSLITTNTRFSYIIRIKNIFHQLFNGVTTSKRVDPSSSENRIAEYLLLFACDSIENSVYGVELEACDINKVSGIKYRYLPPNKDNEGTEDKVSLR